MSWDGILFVTGATVLLLIFARTINQLIFHVSLTDVLIKRDNAAMGIQLSGYLFGVMIIIATVINGPIHGDFLTEVLWVAGFGIAGNIFLAVVAIGGLRLFLMKDCRKYIIEGNTAAGIAAAGSFVATSLVLTGTMIGEGTIVSAIVFFLLGQCSLLFITYIFRLLTTYDDSIEIRDGNIAAAVSYIGLMIAIGIIVRHALIGDLVDYKTSIIAFGNALIVVIILYPVRQWLVQGIVLGGGFKLYGGRLDTEIQHDRNISAGVLEASIYIATALLATNML
ncbi:MAG: DUF350 domain-containing protein [bacterium]